LLVGPAELLTDDIRRQIHANKSALVALLHIAQKGDTGPQGDLTAHEHEAPAPDIDSPSTPLKPAFAELSAPRGAWADSHPARFLDRRTRLLRLGWIAGKAEAVAARLVMRDREADDRVTCVECRHYRPGQCGNYRTAGLQAPEVARALAEILQRCPGFRFVEDGPTGSK